jgi:3-dehydroquinate synthase
MSAQYKADIIIRSDLREYGVAFGKLSDLPQHQHQVLVVDAAVRNHTAIVENRFNGVIQIDAVEINKSLEKCSELLLELSTLGARKSTQIVAIGGGVVQDLITFSASIYMRGLNWVFFPTTLMSIMDSCIGGKSSINLKGNKNILGNFYPPKLIVIDTEFINSLSPSAISSGISEGMKIVFARGENEFKSFKEAVQGWRKNRAIAQLERAIKLSLNAKKWFIEIDEFDQRERKLLNFGHTFGHALEAATDFQVPHGIAVLFGMRAAIYEAGRDEICTELLNLISDELSYSGFLRKRFYLVEQKFKDAIARDKKNSHVDQVLVLPNEKGELEAVTRELSKRNIDSCWKSIRKALDESGADYEIR